MKYMFIIDKVIQQIVIQHEGEDPDPGAALAELDFRSMVNDLADTDRIRMDEEKYRKQAEKSRKEHNDLKRELDEERSKLSAMASNNSTESGPLRSALNESRKDIHRLENYLREKCLMNETSEEIFSNVYKSLSGTSAFASNAPNTSAIASSAMFPSEPAQPASGPPPPPPPPFTAGPAPPPRISV